MNGETPEICAICAWRATCQKKFSISGRNLRCPDFTRDLTIKNEAKDEDEDVEKAEAEGEWMRKGI